MCEEDSKIQYSLPRAINTCRSFCTFNYITHRNANVKLPSWILNAPIKHWDKCMLHTTIASSNKLPWLLSVIVKSNNLFSKSLQVFTNLFPHISYVFSYVILLFNFCICQRTANYRPAGVAKVCNLDANITRILNWVRSSLRNFLVLWTLQYL